MPLALAFRELARASCAGRAQSAAGVDLILAPEPRQISVESVRGATDGSPSRMSDGAMNHDAIEVLCNRCKTKRQAAALWALGQWQMFFGIILAHPGLSFEEIERDLGAWGADPPYLPGSPNDVSSG
jgi:hypothetical protein